MKKLLLLLGLITVFGLTACGTAPKSSAAPAAAPAPAQTAAHKAVLTVGSHQLPVTLYDAPSANDLYSRLPVTLAFEDFSGMEKIAYLDKRLDETGQKVGCHPLAGDICVYQPWGNLSIFYVDFKDDSNLIPIGRLESGLDIIKAQQGDFTATLSKAE